MLLDLQAPIFVHIEMGNVDRLGGNVHSGRVLQLIGILV